MCVYQFRSPELREVQLENNLLAAYAEICSESTIPASILRCAETGRLEAFKLQWKEGMPNRPHIYWDSDVAKVMEGMAYDLILHPDPEKERQLDELVDLVCASQQPDGYLNSYFAGVEPEKRWKNLTEGHELYCAGHLMEAACAYFEATGKRNFLDTMCRYADYIGTVFGWEEGKTRGMPGHEEIELALCRLAEVSGKPEYLKLAAYFIDVRGTDPCYFQQEQAWFPDYRRCYYQTHIPVREQKDAVGHAVRALYLYSGMAELAAKTGDAALLRACENLFESVAGRRMYITGGVGSTSIGEAFTVDYDLPNNTVYAESCAAIALVFFADRMLRITGDGKYADVLEQTLFNGALSGVSLSGDKFFYANLLEVNEHTFQHGVTQTERQKWFDCSCCPTSYCRFLPQTGKYCWSVSENEVRLNIPAAGSVDFGTFAAKITGSYPAAGKISIRILKDSASALSIRIPGWCKKYSLTLNGETCSAVPEKGYVKLARNWSAGDELTLDLEIRTELRYANCAVAENAGRAAICRGPVVYCLESVDNPGVVLHNAAVCATAEFELCPLENLPDTLPGIRFRGWEYIRNNESSALYTAEPPAAVEKTLTAIPYFLWQNRGASAMQVYLLYRN